MKNIAAKEEYFQIAETIKTIEAKTKCHVYQRKFKEFNSLKYKLQLTRELQTTLQSIKEPTAFKEPYTNGISGPNNKIQQPHHLSNTNVENRPQSIQAKYHPEAIQKVTKYLPQKENNLNDSKAKYDN